MSKVKVMILINNLNGEEFLPQAICSCLSQIAKINPDIYYHVIGIDAGSKDNSIKIYRDFGGISLDEQKEGYLKGDLSISFCNGLTQVKDINNTIKKARQLLNFTHFIWCNNDDLLLPNCIEDHINKFNSDPELRMVYSRALFYQDEKIGEDRKQRAFPWGWEMKDNLIREGHNFVCQNSVMLDIRLFDEIGYFNETYKYAFDFEYWTRILKKRISYIMLPQFTVLYQIREGSLTGTKNVEITAEINRIRKEFNET